MMTGRRKTRLATCVAFGLALALLPMFADTYWIDVMVSVGLYALLALSLNIILGQAGIFHMGHAAFYAIGAYTTAILNTMCGWSIFMTMPVAGVMAALVALVVARPIIHLRGDYLLIVTIGIVEIVRIALVNDIFGITGGSNGLFGIGRPFGPKLVLFGSRIKMGYQFYYLVWGMCAVSLALFHCLWNSRFGRALNYIKADDVAAEGCGVDVSRYKLMAFVLGAFWAGMAGTLYASKMMTIAPASFNFMESVIIFAVVILSGGSQLGVLVSAFLFIGLPELMRGFTESRMLLFAIAMMLMMVWRPQGLLPPLARLYPAAERFLKRQKETQPAAQAASGEESRRVSSRYRTSPRSSAALSR